MADDITEGKNYSFEDYYKTDNFDDSELQARLYAEIYYDSNIEGESGTMDASKIIQIIHNMTSETNESERLQRECEEQPLLSETPGADFQKMLSTNQIEFAKVNTSIDKEVSPVAHEYNNENPEDSSVTQEKENETFSEKCTYSYAHVRNKHEESFEKDQNDAIYSKYNVVSKYVKKQRSLGKQIDGNENNSDSEESISEVPVPAKPKPLLIDLQDSDEENNTNSEIDTNDLILKNWRKTASLKTYLNIIPYKNNELEIIETSSSHQNIFSKSKNIDRFYDNNTINCNKSIQTSIHEQEITDIVLNCTAIQRGAKSVSEIKQLSNAGANQRNKSIEDTNQNCEKKSLQKSKENNENNINFQHKIPVISERKSHYIRHMNQDKTSELNNPVMNSKRQCNNKDGNHSKQKRQCTIQQKFTIQRKFTIHQDVTSQSNNIEENRNEYFEPMSEEMRNYYNSNHGQENFDMGELQRGMSKDPRKWTILDEDLMPCPSSRRRTRFWNVRCTNCHRDGHQRYDCSSPRRISSCYMCGMKGHMEFRCPQKMCLTCGKQQNTFRNICEYCRVLYCTMCNSIGHELDQCPDLWRRYHQTTDMNDAPQDPGNVLKPSRLLYCCNCAKRGHESSMCREYRWSEHFPTPVVVTNYTDGPTYTSFFDASDSSGPDRETGFLSETTGSNIWTKYYPQNIITNIQQAVIEDMEPSANTLSSSDNLCISPTLQETVCVSQMEGNVKSSMANEIWSTVKTNLRQTEISDVTFSTIIYSYGYFHDKSHTDARMILKNLSTFFTNRRPMLNSLINREVAPIFLATLLKKAIEFEVKIGFTQRQTLSLQLIAMKEYIEYLYDLLKYWLNLPDDEKDYGIDVNLPINPIKMFNLLTSRMPQLEKMHFTCYAKHIGGMNDPRWIYNLINNDKAKLKQYKGSEETYNRLRKKLWQLQIKLLMIVNTEPKPNFLVCKFKDVMRKLKSGQYLMGEKLDTSSYLRFILLYNQLFVPHTSENTYNTLKRIKNKENKNKNNSLQIQQKSEITQKRDFINNVYFSSTSSCTPENISLENSSAINNLSNNEMLIEEQNVNNVSFEASKINRNCDEIIIIEDFPTQESSIMSLDVDPVSIESEDIGRNELSTNQVNIESYVSANKQNINVNNTVHMMKKDQEKTKKRKKQRKKPSKLNKNNTNIKNTFDTALDLIRQARGFKLSHMMNAADNLQKRIGKQTIRPKHVKTLSKLIMLERKYQKNIRTYYKTLQK